MKYFGLITILLLAISACSIVEDTPSKLNPDSNNFDPSNLSSRDPPARPFNNTNMTRPPISESTILAFESGDVESYCLDNFKQCLAYCTENRDNTNCENLMRKER